MTGKRMPDIGIKPLVDRWQGTKGCIGLQEPIMEYKRREEP